MAGVTYSVRRIITGLPVGRFSSCLIGSFSPAGRKEARAKLSAPDAAERRLQVLGPVQELGCSGRRLENFMVILYLSNPSVSGLVGVICGVLSRCERELPSCLLITIRRLLMFLPQLPFPWTKAFHFLPCLL